MNLREETIKVLRERVAELEAALDPFARQAIKWHSAFRDTDAANGAGLTVGDFRRAERARRSDPLSRPEGSAST